MVAAQPLGPLLSDLDLLRHPVTREPLTRHGDELRGVRSGDRLPIRRAGGPVLDLFDGGGERDRAPPRGSRFEWSREAFDAHYAGSGTYESGESYEARQGGHPRLTGFHQARVKQRLASWLAVAPGHRLLDVGCGAGWFLLDLERRYAARGFNARCFGVDASVEQLRSLATRVNRDQVTNVHAVLANAERLPFADGAFDVVVSSEALEQIERPARAIAEMARVLRPGGQLLLSVPSRLADDLWDLALGPAVRLGKKVLRRREAPTGGFEQFYAPMYPGEVQALVEAADLRITRFEQTGVIPHNHYFSFVPWPLIGPAVAGFEWIEQRLGDRLAPLALHVLLAATKP
jgi:ubiquinone/menaquinone biosynthesis C-methylase UbiE